MNEFFFFCARLSLYLRYRNDTLDNMKKYTIFRLACIILLWVFLCIILLSTRKLDFMVVFSIIASGIVVFVPIYKKYKRGK